MELKMLRGLLFLIIALVATPLTWYAFFLGAKSLTPILFYQGSYAFVLTLISVCSASYFAWRRYSSTLVPWLSGASISLLGVLYALFVVIPVSLDRSVTFFLLSEIALADNVGVTAEGLRESLISKYIGTGDAVGRRMLEQEESGTIIRDGGTIKITPRGLELLCLNPYLERALGYRNDLIEYKCKR